MRTRSVCRIIVWLVAFLCVLPAWAQDSVELKTGAGRAGTGFYTPGHWGLVRSTIVNHDQVEHTPLLVLSTEASEGVQFAKRLWIPPGSQLNTITPVQLTRMPRDGAAGVEIDARLLRQTADGRENIAGQPQIGALNVRDAAFETGVIAGNNEAAVAVSGALREAAGLPSTTAYLSDHAAPTIAAAWEPINMMVLAHQDPQFDPAQIEAIRQWLVGGGRLWIDLENVNPDFAHRLLGHHWDVTVLDRIELTDYTIEGSGEPLHIQVDYPHRMVRIVSPDMEPIHMVRGYPASLRKRVGYGELLVTTLEAPAWLNEEGKATDALRDLNWMTQRDDSAEQAQEVVAPLLQSIAQEQIGYTVLSRGPVLLVLGLFTFVLLGGGLLLANRDRLAHLGWAAPVMAAVAAAVILWLGLARQSEVPFTLASAQWVEAAAEEPYARVSSLVSIYTPPGTDRENAHLQGVGGVAWPDLSALGGRTVRLLWVDGRSWVYPNLPLREGSVQTAARNTVEPLTHPMRAVVRLGESGVVGEVDAGEAGPLADTVILTPSGKLPTTLDADGSLSAPAADPLAADQFFSAGVLGQRQIARQEAYRNLRTLPDFPGQPMLLGWSDGLDTGVSISTGVEERGAALIAIPLHVLPAAAGERVTVPAPFMTMGAFRDPERRYTGAPIYDERSGEWVTNISQAQTVLMQFELPQALRDLQVDAARVRFTLEAPGRRYAVVVYDNGELREVGSGEAPMGTVTVEIPSQAAPQVNEQGAVVVGLRIGEPLDRGASEAWSLTHLDVSVSGVAGGAASSQVPAADAASVEAPGRPSPNPSPGPAAD